MRLPRPPPPTNPAYFTGNPNYFALVTTINNLVRKHNIPFTAAPTAPRSWLQRQSMAANMQMRLTDYDYCDLVHKLNLISPLAQKDPQVSSILSKFLPPGSSLIKPDPPKLSLDQDGRSYTIASRKTAKAQCWMIPGTGSIYVNGVNLAQAVPPIVHRQKIIRPFEAVDALAEFNVWLIVNGGGPSAQVDAAAVAIARGIAVHRPDLAQLLRELKYTKIDTRQVERKKTGQPKARKKNTWVKR